MLPKLDEVQRHPSTRRRDHPPTDGPCASSQGTVVAKAEDTYDYGCQQGGTMTGPVAVPAWGSCAEPRCRRLVVRDSDGTTYEPCVSREEYDRTQVGEFWHGRTDR